MCSAQKWMLPYQDLYVGCHCFLGIYHLLPFGSSELHIFVHKCFIQAFCLYIQLYIDLCLHFHQGCIQFHFCIHFHASIQFHSCIHFIPVFICMPFIITCILFFKIYSFQISFIFTFLHNSELLLKEDNDKYLKLASYQF